MKSRPLAEIIEHAGETYLGIDTGLAGGRPGLFRLLSSGGNSGKIIRGGKIEDWPILGLTEKSGAFRLYGPKLEAAGFFEGLADQTGETVLKKILAFTGALAELEAASSLPGKFHPRGVLFLADEGFLVLPDSVTTGIAAVQKAETRMKEFERYNHPDLQGPEALSFALGCLVYELLAGKAPWEENSEEELHTAMRTRRPLPLRLELPGIKEDVSAFLDRTLSPVSPNRPALKEWKAALAVWIAAGVSESLGEEERLAALKEAERFRRQDRTAASRKKFFRKHGLKLAAALVLLLAAGSLGWSVLSGFLEPRRTSGFSPEEVVRAFYSAVNTFDHETLSDCVEGAAGKGYIDEALNLHVISRMRLAAEMKSGFVNAADWEKQGRPPVKPGTVLYGLTDFRIEERGGTAEEPSFSLAFVRWAPEPRRDKADAPPETVRSEIRERVVLRKHKGDWVIYRMERLSEKRT